MIMLAIGVLLWALVHLFPALLPASRTRIMGSIGEGPYKGLFALGLVAALLLMVFGWRSARFVTVYDPPLADARLLVAVLVLVAFILAGAANMPTNIKRVLRHPMLTGVMVWGVAHLLANGDSRALVLFGGLTVWAAVEMFAINRREGAWVRPEPVPAQKDVMLIVAGAVLTALVAYFHEYLSGVKLIG